MKSCISSKKKGKPQLKLATDNLKTLVRLMNKSQSTEC